MVNHENDLRLGRPKKMFFSTSGLEKGVRRDAWLSAIHGQCGEFAFEFDSREFEASLDVRDVGRFRCARIMQTSKQATRLLKQVDTKELDCYFVILQLAGKSEVHQFGRDAEIATGDIAILDGNAPLSMRYGGRNSQLSLHIPKAELNVRSIDWTDVTATKLPHSWSALVSPFMVSAFQAGNGFSETQKRTISEALVSLLSNGWSDPFRVAGHQPVDSRRAELLALLQNYILGHLDDETLSPWKIAKEHGLSERQIHRVFQSSGHTLGSWIRRSRLDKCAMDLRDRTKLNETITEIAFRWGFSDSAHFSRAFRAEFGESPRAYRAAALQR